MLGKVLLAILPFFLLFTWLLVQHKCTCQQVQSRNTLCHKQQLIFLRNHAALGGRRGAGPSYMLAMHLGRWAYNKISRMTKLLL